MSKTRLEAFSDGVMAIIITIMVLELKAPHSTELSALKPLIPIFFSYIFSFIFIGIYWNNHHHTLQVVHKVSGPVLWANLHLLFWISLIPFSTAWIGEHYCEPWPVALYGIILFFAGLAYYIFIHALISNHPENATLAKAVGKDSKGIISVVLYAIGIPLAFYNTWIAFAFYISVAIMWLIPDKRIEKVISK